MIITNVGYSSYPNRAHGITCYITAVYPLLELGVHYYFFIDARLEIIDLTDVQYVALPAQSSPLGHNLFLKAQSFP